MGIVIERKIPQWERKARTKAKAKTKTKTKIEARDPVIHLANELVATIQANAGETAEQLVAARLVYAGVLLSFEIQEGAGARRELLKRASKLAKEYTVLSPDGIPML